MDENKKSNQAREKMTRTKNAGERKQERNQKAEHAWHELDLKAGHARKEFDLKAEQAKQSFSKGAENIKVTKQQNAWKVIFSVVKILLLLLIILGVPLYLYFFQLDWLKGFKDIDTIVAFLNQYKSQSIFIYIGFQILQIVISVIPGQVFQMAAGYLFGFWPALLYAMTGAVLGTGISFLLAKLLGRDFLHLFFGEEKMSYYIEKLNSRQAYTIVFFLYLIPGLPKDMVSYAAGASEMKFRPFLILAAIGRFPGMVGCLLMGTMVQSENYTGVAIMAVLALIACGICLIYRKKINLWLDKIHRKISQEHKEHENVTKKKYPKF